jgi:uncharacterized membrane protein
MSLGVNRECHLKAVVFLTAVLTGPVLLHAQLANGWIGKRVITQYGTVLQVGNQVFTEYTISLAELDRLEEGNKPRTNQKAGSNPQRR